MGFVTIRFLRSSTFTVNSPCQVFNIDFIDIFLRYKYKYNMELCKGDILMDGTVRSNIKTGSKVMVVQKKDQRTGKLTEGVVMKLLTNSQNHPRGIKVMLEDGIVGRVKEIK